MPNTAHSVAQIVPAALDLLMPLHLRLAPDGRIQGAGPTLRKLLPADGGAGLPFFHLFTVRRPSDVAGLADLKRRAGERLHLTLDTEQGPVSLRGLALPLVQGGWLVNLSFGIGLSDAVRAHRLTDADFAPTDLAVELLYLVEAKSAVMAELRNLNLRLQGAKSAAEEQALTDTLTGLRNRRALEMALERLTRQATPFSLMHMDLDFFKAVNDTLGHAAGDHVLRKVAEVLMSETRSSDLVARVGGDEFVVVFPGLTERTQLGQIARRVIDQLTRPMEYEGKPCRISASIGVTLSTNYDPPDADRMLTDADTALYESKRGGRGQARFHDPAVVQKDSA